jgi:hypothetical protein
MWSVLVDEIDNWAQIGAAATFWWRDDDAITDTCQLDDLLACAGQTPVALAVIPNLVDRSLSKRIASCRSVTVLQHGWRHANHALRVTANIRPAAT